MKRRILLVDDDLAVLLTLKAILELHGFEVETANSTAEALARLQASTYHIVISDLRMETEESGIQVIRAAHRQSYDPATALLTAFPPENMAPEGENEEKPESMLIKPIGTSDLVRQIEALLIQHADRRSLRQQQTSSQQPLRRPAN